MQDSERLEALESALASSPNGWRDDPAEGAAAWIQEQKNWLALLTDLESARDGGADYPRVWGKLGWAHRPAEVEQEANGSDGAAGARVL